MDTCASPSTSTSGKEEAAAAAWSADDAAEAVPPPMLTAAGAAPPTDACNSAISSWGRWLSFVAAPAPTLQLSSSLAQWPSVDSGAMTRNGPRRFMKAALANAASEGTFAAAAANAVDDGSLDAAAPREPPPLLLLVAAVTVGAVAAAAAESSTAPSPMVPAEAATAARRGNEAKWGADEEEEEGSSPEVGEGAPPLGRTPSRVHVSVYKNVTAWAVLPAGGRAERETAQRAERGPRVRYT